MTKEHGSKSVEEYFEQVRDGKIQVLVEKEGKNEVK